MDGGVNSARLPCTLPCTYLLRQALAMLRRSHHHFRLLDMVTIPATPDVIVSLCVLWCFRQRLQNDRNIQGVLAWKEDRSTKNKP
ncbi:hypothetical protein M405DRAFT_49385 [Rhizopogon salebrosus TDB-379]|nr:hypothetical protein M405DRAFT_49385 [Rhizopogon salebrosus TDB-379]